MTPAAKGLFSELCGYSMMMQTAITTNFKVDIILANSYLVKYCTPRLASHFLVLSTGLIMWIGHRKEIRKLTFWALALRRSRLVLMKGWWRANARKVSFQISLWWPIHIINPVDKTKLSCNTSPTQHHSLSLETYPLYMYMMYMYWAFSPL